MDPLTLATFIIGSIAAHWPNKWTRTIAFVRELIFPQDELLRFNDSFDGRVNLSPDSGVLSFEIKQRYLHHPYLFYARRVHTPRSRNQSSISPQRRRVLRDRSISSSRTLYSAPSAHSAASFPNQSSKSLFHHRGTEFASILSNPSSPRPPRLGGEFSEPSTTEHRGRRDYFKSCTSRLMPLLSTGTLKLISNPIGHPPSFR
jgi:hypothetical protein